MKKLFGAICMFVLLVVATFGLTYNQPTTASADGDSVVSTVPTIASNLNEQQTVTKTKSSAKPVATPVTSQPTPATAQPAATQPVPTPEPNPVACTNNYPDPSCTKPEEPTLTPEPMPITCTNSYPVQSCTY